MRHPWRILNKKPPHFSEQKHSCKGVQGLSPEDINPETKVQAVHQIAFANQVGKPETKIRAI